MLFRKRDYLVNEIFGERVCIVGFLANVSLEELCDKVGNLKNFLRKMCTYSFERERERTRS